MAEYLLAEVLDRQPEEVRRLLLCTSILERVNGELADLLTEDKGGERVLQDLEYTNAFVISLDGSRSWFHYHQMFAGLLQLELHRRLPGQVPVLHRRAAGWFTRHGQVAEGIRHTQAAGDWPDAARLLADQSFSLTLDGQAQTIQALLRAFPQGADYPELALVRADGLKAEPDPKLGEAINLVRRSLADADRLHAAQRATAAQRASFETFAAQHGLNARSLDVGLAPGTTRARVDRGSDEHGLAGRGNPEVLQHD